jgi:hypothetical protein
VVVVVAVEVTVVWAVTVGLTVTVTPVAVGTVTVVVTNAVAVVISVDVLVASVTVVNLVRTQVDGTTVLTLTVSIIFTHLTDWAYHLRAIRMGLRVELELESGLEPELDFLFVHGARFRSGMRPARERFFFFLAT